ncbi:MAG TPA: ATP-binding protein [Anaerolineae bacterium]|nr:ATP-binding protein [Anaerolineae bacterium]
MIDRRLKLLFPSRPQSLDAIRKEVRDIVADTPYQTRQSDILLVVSEACTNIVRHAYAKNHRGPLIIVECILRDDTLAIAICDRGKGLARSTDRPVFSEDGGFGLFLMQKLVDRFRCHSSPGSGTVVEVVFKNPKHLTPRMKKRRAYDAAGQASALWLGLIDMITYPKKGLVAYRGSLGLGVLLPIDTLKPYWRTRMASYFIKSEVNGLRKMLRSEDYELSKSIVEQIGKQVRLIERDFHRLTPKERLLLKRNMEYTYSRLSELKQELIAIENEKTPNLSGACTSVLRVGVVDLITEISDYIGCLIDDKDGCRISLDEGPLQVI